MNSRLFLSQGRDCRTFCFRTPNHRTIECRGVRSASNSLNSFRIPDLSRDACKRIERIFLRGVGKKNQEDDVDRISINRVEIERILATDEHPEWLFELWHARMRNGDAADPRASRFSSSSEIRSAGRSSVEAARADKSQIKLVLSVARVTSLVMV
jgi:hypothetical protein